MPKICQWIRWPLVLITACGPFGAKPLSKPILGYYQLGTNFSEIFIKIQNFSFAKMHLKISSAKQLPFCPGGEELMAGNVYASENWVIIGIANDLMPIWHQAIVGSNADLSIGSLGSNFSEFWIKIEKLLQENVYVDVYKMPANLFKPHGVTGKGNLRMICGWYNLSCFFPIYFLESKLLAFWKHIFGWYWWVNWCVVLSRDVKSVMLGAWWRLMQSSG